VAHNVETVPAAGGYEPHFHRDLDIVSWVTSGALQHSDDHGHLARVEAGSVQRLTAAAGVTHAEISAAGPGGPATQFVQLWLRCPADELPSGAEPSYQHGVVPPHALRGGWVALASSDSSTSPVVRLHVPGTTLWALELGPGAASQLPSGALVHVYVVRGAIGVGDVEILDAEDTMLLRDCGPVAVRASRGAQVLALCMSV
jgi:redox-sensitive bicupin YhaK (pirin superfamily)